jgi:ABC-type branched-subunit amino acid transport system ATPase component
LLNVEALTAGYTQLPVITGIGLRAEAGSIVAIVGPNGSGKSTLLKAIIGLLKPMSGRVEADGQDLTGWPTHRIVSRGIGYVPQFNNVFVSLNIVENLEMGAFSFSGDPRPRVEKVLESFPDLAAARTKKAGALSGGQRNLLGVARALMLEPKVILVDEPTAGLAPKNSARVWEALTKIAAGGTAVVVVEQNVDMALGHAHRAYVMVAGRNRLDGTADEVRAHDLHAIFLGQHEPNGSDDEEGGPSGPRSNGAGISGNLGGATNE